MEFLFFLTCAHSDTPVGHQTTSSNPAFQIDIGSAHNHTHVGTGKMFDVLFVSMFIILNYKNFKYFFTWVLITLIEKILQKTELFSFKYDLIFTQIKTLIDEEGLVVVWGGGSSGDAIRRVLPRAWCIKEAPGGGVWDWWRAVWWRAARRERCRWTLL